MKTVVGFCFTDNPVESLAHAGFVFLKNEKTIGHGYYEFLCPLSPGGLNLELREVVDEELYFEFQKKRSFAPFVHEHPAAPAPWPQHPNSVFEAVAVLGADMDEGELKTHLQIRKKHDICAVWLKCRDPQLFANLALPQKKYEWQGKPAFLIELGQSCYDLVVT